MRAFAIGVVVELIVAAVILHSSIKDFLWAHPWWHSFLIAIPTIAVPILAYLEYRHSKETAVLQGQVANLTAKLAAERNKHLQQIAKNTEQPITQATRNANLLRKHMNANVVVSEGQGNWGNTPEIADISEENIVTLFTPPSYSSPNAWSVGVRCEDLEITDIPQGSCPLRIKILKRYGPEVKLGEIKSWEDRFQAAAKPVFNKGGAAFQATYGKAGSSERRSIYVYASNDGANSFLLEASTGESICGSNEAVSKNFLVLEVEYKAAGFERSGSGTSGSSHRLFIQ